MKKFTLLTVMLLSVVSSAQININEIDTDQEGTDTQEFIELFSETPTFSLDGYIVVLYNGSDDLSYKTIDLTGYSTDTDGFFIIGDNEVPDADITIGASNRIQNGPDAIAIYLDDPTNFPNGSPVTTTNLIDAIVYGTDDDDDAELLAGLGETVQYDEDLNGNKDTESIQNDSAKSYCVALPSLRLENGCLLEIVDSKFNLFQIYPNPASDGYITIISKLQGPKTVSVFDVLGKKIMKTVLTGDQLNIDTINSGVYLIKIEQANASTTEKLVIK